MSWNEIPEHLEGAARVDALNRREFLRRSAITAGIGLGAAATLSPSQVLAALSKAQRMPVPTGADMPIDTFVVLMMENRSFDHYFGWLDPEKADASQQQVYLDEAGVEHRTRHTSELLGAEGQWQGCGFEDPGHGWGSGRAQLRNGFMGKGAANDELALTYFNEGELEFIHAAGKAFTIYDKYFCSVLGPTWPNRYYKWSAQSGGRTNNSPPVETAGNQWETIFDRADATNGAVTAQYYNSDLPFSAVWGQRAARWTRPVAEYYARCATGTLPNITFVDPPFRDGGGFDGASADEHPLADVRLGQAFMADVVSAFLASPQFRRGALFIVYDEWGGFFDHVRPISVPDDRQSPNLDQDFGQLGFRTPAVALSPYTLGGRISNVGPLAHESILKLIEQRFGFAPLCKRDREAVSIGESFDWTVDPAKVEVPDLPHPERIVSRPCSFGGGDVVDPGGAHAGDMDALEELAQRVGVPIGDGKPHNLFRAPDSVRKAFTPS